MNRATWLTPLAFFVAIFAVYALTAEQHRLHIDAHAATVESWRIASVGNPWLEHVMSPDLTWNKYISEAPNGHIVGQRMAGPILAGIPFYFLFGRGAAAESLTYLPGALASAWWTAAAVTLMFLALRRLLGDRSASIAAALFAFTTPTWTVSANMQWTHTVTQFGIAGAAYAASRGRWWVAGTFLAVGMLARPHVAVIAAVLGLGMAWSTKSVRPALQIAVPTALALPALLVWNHWVFGGWSIGGAYSGRFEAAASGFHGSDEWDGPYAQLVNMLGFLVSPDKGLFVWTPVLLLLLPVVVRSFRDLPSWSKWLLAGGVVYTFFQLRLNYFPGGDGIYGYRHGLELLTSATPAYALAVGSARRMARLTLPLLLGAQFAALFPGTFLSALYVPLDDVWIDNSFWIALRHEPVIVGVWLCACLAGAFALEKLRGSSRPISGPPTDVASSRWR